MPNFPDVDTGVHHKPVCFSDWFALIATKILHLVSDAVFGKRYGNRAIGLETIAAVPGMVGGVLTHLKCLQRVRNDQGWIRTLIEEAENERMHLMTFTHVAVLTRFERWFVSVAMWLFYFGFLFLYLISAKTAHRMVGYFEEAAVESYSRFLCAIDEGRFSNPPAPDIAKRYWGLPDGAMLRDVVLVVRADEAHHRDVNHNFSGALAGKPPLPIAPYPEHAQEICNLM